MYLRKAKIENYKSFWKTKEVEFQPGFNVVVGQNNVGKTALLEILSRNFTSIPHKTIETMPTPQTFSSSTVSSSEILFELKKYELLNIFRTFLKNQVFGICVPFTPNDVNYELFMTDFLFRDLFQFVVKYSGANTVIKEKTNFPNFGIEVSPNNQKMLRYQFDDEVFKPVGATGVNLEEDIWNKFANVVEQQMYFFKAERMKVGECVPGQTAVLANDASNLPEVLDSLQSNPERYKRYNAALKRVFPQIDGITVKIVGRDRVRANVWQHEMVSEREDLAVPLTMSGTGISQVASLLYVVLTSEFPRIIFIDEPNSFLHPGAVKKLFEILREYPQHQYIVSTHSPGTINACGNPNIISVVWDQKRKSSDLSAFKASETLKMQSLLSDIGSSFSDVFGADNVIWVEGKTEEKCFPEIILKLCTSKMNGTTLTSVVQTGDLEGRHARKVFQIYRQLSAGESLMPRALAFIFDREMGAAREVREELAKENPELVKLLKRVMFENYLIDSQAIHSIFIDVQKSVKDIDDWIEQNKLDKAYYKADCSFYKLACKTPSNWTVYVDGAKFLSDLFSFISDGTAEFSKTLHSVQLTKWLLKNKPETLREVANLLDEALAKN